MKPRPACEATRTLTVCVVDPNAGDYEGWWATAERRGLQLKFVASADAALRLARGGQVDLWVVNTALPGLSGFDLCGMLRRQSERVPVFMVAGEYSIEAEQAAWHARASMFGCKPEHAQWLDEWLDQQRTPRRIAIATELACGADACLPVSGLVGPTRIHK